MKFKVSKEELRKLVDEGSNNHICLLNHPDHIELEGESVDENQDIRTPNCGCECHEKYTYKSHCKCCFVLKQVKPVPIEKLPTWPQPSHNDPEWHNREKLNEIIDRLNQLSQYPSANAELMIKAPS
jgi:hypothetical protein